MNESSDRVYSVTSESIAANTSAFNAALQLFVAEYVAATGVLMRAAGVSDNQLRQMRKRLLRELRDTAGKRSA